MRISVFQWIFLNSFVAVFFFSINVVLVSGQCQNEQRDLLLGLKNDFNSTLSAKLKKWNQTTDCCVWDGVRCDAHGQVIVLDLTNQRISGALENSSSLFRLQHLQLLNLSRNIFSSAFPSGFDKLPNLRHLNLSNAGFSGQIPDDISRMTRLVTLDLSVNLFYLEKSLKLEKPDLHTLVQNLTRLRFLHLNGVNISTRASEWCQALSSLTELQVLSMSNCNLLGPIDSSLSKLQSLSVIRLDNNNFSASIPPFFAEFPNLTSLRISAAGLRGTLPEKILQIPTLQTLDLSTNELLEGTFQKFPEKASLQTLALSGTKFGGQIPESIGNLGQLTRIEISSCNFSGPIPQTVKNLTQLVYLDFSQNNFSGPIPSFSSSRNLTLLNLAYNQLNGTIDSTNWSGLSKLVSVDLRNNQLNGPVPLTLFGIPSLQKIFLSQNQFGGNLGNHHVEASSLDTLYLGSNKLQGPVPGFVFDLQGLKSLSLSSNNFSGFIPLSAIQNLRNLSSLDLSHNRLSINASATNPSFPSFPNFTTLKLASCNLTGFPDFLKNLPRLTYLDLSNNNIHGEIPKWIWETKSLLHLNLSQNFLVGFERPLQNITSSTLSSLDLHGNQLQGQIPFPQYATYLDYSNNNFSSVLPVEIGDYLSVTYFFSLSSNNIHGSIPVSICNSTYLQVLDLSNNSLSGEIPPCLINTMSLSLGVLNLRINNLTGNISDGFRQDCRLQTLDLDRNLLHGRVPKSLANCNMLEVLDLGNNQINDKFPCHLKNISTLHVLVLRANKFDGSIHCDEMKNPWPLLQIVDLAKNNFSGKLHETFLETWRAMQAVEDEAQSKLKHLQFKVLQFSSFYYQDAITVTTKGLELELQKILTVFTSMDISSNKLEGPIPNVIGTFKALYILNFSHNAFSGPIPSSLGNLRQLESLDLSSNSFSREIPLQLAELSFLSFLNVSNNMLEGPIPTGTQLQSFPEASYENNTGLCGLPLNVSCNVPPLATKCQLPPTIDGCLSDSGTGRHIDWNIISTETGYFFGFGIVVLPLMCWKRWRICYYKHIDRALFRLFPRLEKHGRRANRSQRRRR